LSVPYAYQHRSHCRGCDREREPDEVFSARGKCAECRIRPLVTNIRDLHAHRGEAFLRWRRSVAASVGAILIEDLESETEADAA
jgi:hypothetical protein